MTQLNPFLQLLQTAPVPQDRRRPVLDLLDQFCQGVEQYWSGRLDCSRLPGYPTNYGQEYRVVVRSIATGYEHALLRAYVPESGSQVRVDFYEGELVEYLGASDLKVGLEAFLAKPETLDAINAYARP